MAYRTFPTAASRAIPTAGGAVDVHIPSATAMTLQGRTPTVVNSGGAFALQFPQNTNGTANNLPYAVIQFANPQNDGLPMWGPGNAGVTIIRKIRVTATSGHGQPGYYGMFWYSRGDGHFDSGGIQNYYGFHPYPNPPGASTSHNWEIAAVQADFTDTLGGGPLAVQYGVTLIQALVVTRVSSTTKRLRMYCNLPSVSNNDIVQPDDVAYDDNNPSSSPMLTIGDSPWFADYQNERFGGILDWQQIYARALSQAEVLQVAAAPTAPLSGLWWFKYGFDSVDDLTCPYTGRSFVRNDTSNLITTVARL